MHVAIGRTQKNDDTLTERDGTVKMMVDDQKEVCGEGEEEEDEDEDGDLPVFGGENGQQSATAPRPKRVIRFPGTKTLSPARLGRGLPSEGNGYLRIKGQCTPSQFQLTKSAFKFWLPTTKASKKTKEPKKPEPRTPSTSPFEKVFSKLVAGDTEREKKQSKKKLRDSHKEVADDGREKSADDGREKSADDGRATAADDGRETAADDGKRETVDNGRDGEEGGC
jgi:hypothetical protein